MAAEAWVTLATNDSYAIGVLVLANSLKLAKSTRPVVVMVTDQVSSSMRDRLKDVSCLVTEVNVLDSEDSAHLALLARPELGITFTKLHCWTLTDYSKCVFLDADTLVIRNCDELFDREEFSAASDAGWPDCFNSGVFVFKPSLETYSKLIAFAVSEGSFDGGDQGLLNSYFSDWATKDISNRLPFIYNMTAPAIYSYRPAYKQYGKNVRIVHFIGSPKPWQVSDISVFQSPVASEHVAIWWEIFLRHVQPQLSVDMINSPPNTLVYHEESTHDEVLIVKSFADQRQHLWNVAKETVEARIIPVQSDPAPPQIQPEPTYQIQREPIDQTFHEPEKIDQTKPIDQPSQEPEKIDQTTFIESQTIASDHLDSFASDHSAQPEDTGVAAQLAQLDIDDKEVDGAVAGPRAREESEEHRKAWERGEIDYTGKDSFDNIMQKILATLASNKKP